MGKGELLNIINRCCDILRTDDGINTAMQYTETLSWLLYLKFFHDMEEERQGIAVLSGEEYVPLLAEQYRWDYWTGRKAGLSGQELTDFVNDELFPYLRELKGTKEGDPRDIISAIFDNSSNRVSDGYLLADVIGQIQKIGFGMNDDAFALSHIYEELLKNMGEGGGNAGEFYTPRPLVRVMVQMLDPQLGETIYDPACGTGGFLAEAHAYLDAKANTAERRRILNYQTFFGQEKTPLPYVLCLMNLSLHGMDYPRINRMNTLSRDIRSIEEHEKHDVILANPPFGGKEQSMLQQNFPIKASATEHLFIQHMEKMLKTRGRAAIVVPEGVLFQTNAAYKSLKEKLLKECNVHTVLSLPAGTFIPYSAVKTSVLFFDKSKRTEDVWFYEVPLLDNKKLTKKNGITEKHFAELLTLYRPRPTTERSWLVPVEKIIANDASLSASHYNPHGIESEDLLEPAQYAAEIKGLLSNCSRHIDSLLDEVATTCVSGETS